MKIKIICVGKLKEKYLEDGINEYLKRLSAYGDVEAVSYTHLLTLIVES